MSILGASAFQFPYPANPPANKMVDDNILGCYPDGNNYSKVCPVLYCNYGKQNQQNNDIFKRLYPENNMEVIPTYRGKYKVCQEVRNLNDEKELCKEFKGDYVEPCVVGGAFNPGKPDVRRFFQLIDIDSSMKLLDCPMTLCPGKKFAPQITKDITVNQPELDCKSWTQNYKYYEFDDRIRSQPPTLPKKCGEGIQPWVPYNNTDLPIQNTIGPMFNRLDNYNGEGTLCYNQYMPSSKITCLKPMKECREKADLRQPILFQSDTGMFGNTKMRIGPSQSSHNHTMENVWNNFTNRKLI